MTKSSERLQKAQNYLQNGKPERAESIARKLLKDASTALPSRLVLVKALTEQGKITQAAQIMGDAANLVPDNTALQQAASDMLLKSGQEQRALPILARMLEHMPPLIPSHHAWLQLQFSAGEFEAILIYADQYGARVSADALCMRTIASAFENWGKHDKALEHINQALVLDPNNAEFLTSRGRLHLYMGNFPSALQDLNTVLSNTPDDPSAQQNRCMTHKCMGNIATAAKDEFGRLALNDQHAKFHFSKPLWQGEILTDKHLLIWSDMGVGDVVKFAPLVKELPKANKITLLTQPKTVAFLKAALPGINIQPLPNRREVEDIQAIGGRTATFEDISEDFDVHMPLGGLYTQLRPDLESFRQNTKALELPNSTRAPFWDMECMNDPSLTRVGLAWSSVNSNRMKQGNYLPLEDLLPILRLPGFAFYNCQYSANEEQITRFREQHGVPLYHAPGLDLMDDILSSAAFTSCLDLYVSPANSSADIAGAMGVKSYRADLIHLPESLGQDRIPWYEDQKALTIPWGHTIQEFLPQIINWLTENKGFRSKNRP